MKKGTPEKTFHPEPLLRRKRRKKFWGTALLLLMWCVGVGGKLTENGTAHGLVQGVHFGGTHQSERFIGCHFNPLCLCKYDQRTELFDSMRRLWETVGFNQTNFFLATQTLVKFLKSQPTNYFVAESEIHFFASLLVNASLSPVPQSPAFLVEPGPVFDIDCANVPIALIPTEYNSHGVISHVSVSGSKLSLLDGSAFAGLEIQGIRLSRNQLYFINEYAFSSMGNSLSMLDLSGNFLDEIPFAAFKSLKLLEWLNLSNNLINGLMGDWFALSGSLRKLILSTNSIDSLPQKLLGSFPRLHWLDLSSNFIRNVSQLSFPPNLQTLNVMKNRLSTFPVSLFHLQSLSWLFLGGCAIDSVPEDWPVGVRNRQMNQLDISENFLHLWPSKAFGSQLTVLDLSASKNYLQTLPDAAFSQMGIYRLTLGYNRLQSIHPGALASLQDTLKYLNLENNRLKAVPWPAVANLSSLMHLYVGSNSIQDDGVGTPPPGLECKLTYLGLNGNQLTRIPMRILQKCPHLFHLNLGYNQIAHLDQLLHMTPYSARSSNKASGGGSRKFLRMLNTLILRNNPLRTLSFTHADTDNVLPPSVPTQRNASSEPSPGADGAGKSEPTNKSFLSSTTDSASNELFHSQPSSSSSASSGSSLASSPLLPSPTSEMWLSEGRSTEDLGGGTLASTIALTNIFRKDVFPSLHELSLSFCQLAGELEAFPSSALTTLEISMGLKSATSLHPSHFNSLRNLEWLALDFNTLSFLSDYTFYSNRRLSYVNLEWNRLGVLPPQMFHPDIHQSMTQLRLSHNRIQLLQAESFLSFPAINLDLSYNQISMIEKHAFLTAMPVPGVPGNRNVSGKRNESLSPAKGPAFAPSFLPTFPSNSIHAPPPPTKASKARTSARTAETYIGGLSTAQVVAAARAAEDERPGLNLYLNHNRVSSIKAGAFSQEKFNLIDLSHNALPSFSSDVFGRGTLINGLNISHNMVERLVLKPSWAGTHLMSFLDASHNRISVRTIELSGLCITRLLDLSHNRLERTETRIFPSNCSLKELRLNWNSIGTLETNSFAHLMDLAILDLSANQIVLLPPVVFIRNTKLRSLDLSQNRLRSLPRDSLVGSAIEILNLGSNQFVNLPVGALSQISRRLRRLDISQNSLEHLDSTMFESIAGLVHLNLSSNRLSILPDNAFANLASLRELDLSFNSLTANFKELFHFLPKLKVLRLCGCGIKQLPFLPLPHLLSLDLSSNGLQEIKMQSLGSLTRLRNLDLSSNELSSSRVPNWTPLYNLVSLKMNRNPLKSLTKDTFYGLGRLESLELLHIDQLERFDTDVLSHLSNLRSLAVETYPNIEKYRFRLGAILSSIPHLEELRVRMKEATLSDQLQGIQNKLRKLTINGEKLRRIEPNALDGLENCFHIDLAITHTSIEELPSKLFEKLQGAAWARLDLSHNRFVSLDTIAFYSNRSAWFSRGTKILEGGLVLSGNDWICDCNLVSLGAWLRRWLRESFESHSTDNIPLVHSMYESLREPKCTDSKGRSQSIVDLYSDAMCSPSALSSAPRPAPHAHLAHLAPLPLALLLATLPAMLRFRHP